MPNWCWNDLTLHTEDTEKADALESFLKTLTEEDVENDKDTGLFAYFHPRPVTEEENWYGWNIDNWGTKWDVTEVEWQRDENTFYLNFSTAWGPPISFYEKLYEDGDWNVDAMYEEPGMCFVGSFSEGVDDYYEYDFDDEDWAENIPQELIDFAGLESSYEFHIETLEE